MWFSAAGLLALTATPAFAQRLERGGYQDAAGRYHDGGATDVDAGYTNNGYSYYGGYSSTYSYYPYSTPSYSPYQNYYYTPVSTTDNSAKVQVRVPANAKLWFDDNPTQQTGTLRSFYTPQLDPGKTFKYTVRAQWDDNGKKMEKTKEIDVRAGRQTEVDFTKQ